MKKLLLICTIFWTLSLLAVAPTPLETVITETLSSSGIISDHTNNPKLYRLGDAITRAETVGIGLKAAQIELPDDYFCKNYFRDVKYDRLNNWVCRAIEMGADNNLITRTNDRARPSDSVTRIEALAIIMRAGRVPYDINVERKNYPDSIPQWQVDILEGALQYHLISSVATFGPNAKATRLDVFGMVYNLLFAGKKNADVDAFGNSNTTSTQYYNFSSAPEKDKSSGISVYIPGTTPSYNSAGTKTTQKKQTYFPAAEQEPAELGSFAVSAPEEVKTNVPFTMTIKALDVDGSIITNYEGTVYLDLTTGSYENIILPTGDEGFTFSPENQGVITIQGILVTAPGNYEIDVYEIDSGKDISEYATFEATDGFVSTVTDDNVSALGGFVVTVPPDVIPNVPFSVTVTAVNSAGQTLPDYLGTVYFELEGASSGILVAPESYTFERKDRGKKVFSNTFTIKAPGTFQLKVYEIDTIPNGTEETVDVIAK